ncbi:hypothetical protein NPIRD3C_1151 [Nitrosopumilus piranensis]|uniref:Uncharacterized protein n=1 Tax=Nitrosopumilus piranensis TaxID=1582439 RepID=A0A0C5BRI1_9ARCH|nr:hypothetical protein NPIRD3C_1151 [Nitrosopumilus piranensis]
MTIPKAEEKGNRIKIEKTAQYLINNKKDFF